MDPQLLAQIEQACYVLYNPTSSTSISPKQISSPHQITQEESARFLSLHFPSFGDANSPQSSMAGSNKGSPSSLSSPLDAVFHCKSVLEQSSSPYAQLYVASHLKSIVSVHYSLLSLPQKIDLRSFVLDHLYRHPLAPQIVVTTLSVIFSTITKYSWFDDEQFKAILPDISNFLEASVDQKIIGMILLGDLIAEVNHQTPFSKSKKTAINFRDSSLLACFQLALEMLRKIVQKEIACDTRAKLDRLVDSTLKSVRNCLQFDFLGVNPDESSEDISSIQFPTSWKETVSNTSVLQTFYDAYIMFDPPHSNIVLECFSMMISARRTLFLQSEKLKYLQWILSAMTEILKTGKGLDEEVNVHEFCRVLSRFKWVNQTTELMDYKELYKDWIEHVTKFTTNVVFIPENFAKHSYVYIVTFWKDMIASCPTGARTTEWEHLVDLATQVTCSFISSRVRFDVQDQMSSDQIAIDEELFEDSDGSMILMLENVARIARTRYESFKNYIKQAFEILATRYTREGIKHPQLMEVKFTWIVYIIGSAVGARPPSSHSSISESDTMDGELSCTVLQLMQVYQSLLSRGDQVRSKNLDLAFLHFFLMFRKSYIGSETVSSGLKVYGPLGDMFGLSEQKLVMDMFMQRLASNLRTWNESQAIIDKSLALFDEMASGYSSVKLIRKTETVNLILSHHTSDYFQFLLHPANAKSRTTYYSVLGKLLATNDESFEQEFFQFMTPFSEQLSRLSQVTDYQFFRRDDVRAMLNGIFRDLRGLLLAFIHQPTYSAFFSCYPYMSVVLRGVEANYDHSVSNVILKFMCSFVEDRCFRISKEINETASPSGILLFRETSKMLVAYGQLAVRKEVLDSKKWAEKYKGFAYCFKIMGYCLDGKYCNFGIFELFNDNSLKDAFGICFQMMLSIPFEDMLSFPKLSQSFLFFLKFTIKLLQNRFTLVDCHFEHRDVYMYIVRILAEEIKYSSMQMGTSGQGVNNQEVIFSASCEIADLLSTFIFKQSTTPQTMMGGKQSTVVHYASEYPQLLQYLLSKILDVVFFDDGASQYTISKPLLPLILLNKEYFDYYVNSLLSAQVPERQEQLAIALQTLMGPVEGNLVRQNRESFATRLGAFKRERESQMMTLIMPKGTDPSIDGF